MDDDMRGLVRRGYNKGDYATTYQRKNTLLDAVEQAFFTQLTKNIPPNSKILDLGCGVGLPYDKYLVEQGYEVVGVDISEKHVREAQKNVPEATYYQGDFLREDNNTYDAILSLYAIFHTPREEHANILNHIYTKLKPGGCALLTLGVDDMPYAVEENFAGSKMAWSSYDTQTNKQLVEQAGFTTQLATEDLRKERHLWILAQKNLNS